MKDTKYMLGSIEKAIKVLFLFQGEKTVWGVREISAHLGYNPTTVQRILNTLKAYSFVDQDLNTRRYRLGNIFFSFLQTLQTNYSVIGTVQPLMNDLLSRIQETVHLETIEGMNRICIHTIESSKRLKASMPIGSKAPLYSGATSKCLLAFSSQDFIEEYLKDAKLIPITKNTITGIKDLRKELESIRKKGYAESLGELTPGLGALSAPLFNHRGDLLAALSLAIPERRYMELKHRKLCIKELIHTAAECSHVLGYLKHD